MSFYPFLVGDLELVHDFLVSQGKYSQARIVLYAIDRAKETANYDQLKAACEQLLHNWDREALDPDHDIEAIREALGLPVPPLELTPTERLLIRESFRSMTAGPPQASKSLQKRIAAQKEKAPL